MPNSIPYVTLFMDPSQDSSDTLPTPNEIDGSELIVDESACTRLARIRENFVIKFGTYVQPIEGHNMLYVAKSTTVPIPKVYAMYQSRQEQRVITYIVMQFVPGATLVDVWGGLGEARKTAIATTLRTYFDQLRHLEPPGWFGDIDGGPPLDSMLDAARDTDGMKSALPIEDELIDGIVQAFTLEAGERMAHKARYYQHVLPAILRSNAPPVFTHNDFQRKNVIVQPDGALVIIDWEFSSWCPTYWEYSSALFCNAGWFDDWHDYLNIILDEYPNEAMWLANVKREMWF